MLYHSLGDSPPAVTVKYFRNQIVWLSENVRLLSLATLLGEPAVEGLCVAITFDDGYVSLHDSVAPILAEHGAAATVFLNTGWIGETARRASDAAHGHYANEHFMTWREVDALAKSGWTVGSHGVAHLDLTRQPERDVARELADSKREVETHLARPCRHFAYTWGRFTPALKDAVKGVGYESAVSGLHGPVRSSSDRYALPRIDVRGEYELQDFADVVVGRWDFLGLKQRLMRTLA